MTTSTARPVRKGFALTDAAREFWKHPSPWMIGRAPSRHADTNRGITAAYSLAGSCPGPYTLKYRSHRDGIP